MLLVYYFEWNSRSRPCTRSGRMQHSMETPSTRRPQPAAFDRLEVFCATDLERASTRVNRAPRQPVRKSRRRSATAGRDWTDGFGLERGPKPADESPQESAIQFLRGNSAGSDVTVQPVIQPSQNGEVRSIARTPRRMARVRIEIADAHKRCIGSAACTPGRHGAAKLNGLRMGRASSTPE